MKALISLIEPRKTGFRVAQVVQDDQTFPVAEGLIWLPCPDNILADEYWYDLNNQIYVQITH